MYLTENMPTRSAKWATATAIVAAALLACGSRPRRPAEAPRVNSYRLQTERGELAGTMTTVAGYLISTQMIGDDVCLQPFVPALALVLLLSDGFGYGSDELTE